MSFEVKSSVSSEYPRSTDLSPVASRIGKDDTGERLCDTPREYKKKMIIQYYSQDTTKGTSPAEKIAWWRFSSFSLTSNLEH